MAPLIAVMAFAPIGCGSSTTHPQSKPVPPPAHALEEAARRAKQAELKKPEERKLEVTKVEVEYKKK